MAYKKSVRLIAFSRREEVEAEPPRAVKPFALERESGFATKLGQLLQVELVRILGVNSLAFLEARNEVERADGDRLSLAAGDVHFYPSELLVIDGSMRELLYVELASKLAVDPHEQVQVEGRSHAERVIVSRQQYVSRFLQVGPNQQNVCGPQHPANFFEEFARLFRVEIADVRPKKQRDGARGGARGRACLSKLSKRGEVIGCVSRDAKLRVSFQKLKAAGFKARVGNVYRQGVKVFLFLVE